MNEKIIPYLTTFYFLNSKGFTDFPPGYSRDKKIVEYIRSKLLEYYSDFVDDFGSEIDRIAHIQFEKMVSTKCLKKVEDDFAGSYYKYLSGNYDGYRSSSLNQAIASRYNEIGPSFMTDVLSAIIREDNSQVVEAAPAADRVVPLNHNDPAASSLKQQAAQFVEDLKSANDLGNLNAVERDVAIYEAFQLSDLLHQPAVRASEVEARSIRLLKWVAEAAGSGLIGAAALALLAAIAAFFGFPL
ncbi:MAG: hypothetical protein KAF27_09250 [Porphyrobacter sp.]|uniref:hypothetical protein n=1 Tax=Sphingopyxis sp. Q841 TaxID=3458250 RepID=UPI004035F566|nr:hypothetical protein [Porphyrobacter sp.]